LKSNISRTEQAREMQQIGKCAEKKGQLYAHIKYIAVCTIAVISLISRDVFITKISILLNLISR